MSSRHKGLIQLHLEFYDTFLQSDVLHSELEAKILGVIISVTLYYPMKLSCH